MLAMERVLVVSFLATTRTGLCAGGGEGAPGQFSAHNARGNGEDGVAQDHHQGGQDLAGNGLGGDVAIAYRGHGHNGPIDGPWDAGESSLWIFHHVHHRAQKGDQDEHGRQEDDDFASACVEGGAEGLGFL